MYLKIRVKTLADSCMPEVFEKGEWIDLRSAETVNLTCPQADTLKTHKVGEQRISHRDVNCSYHLLPLGVAMKLPKGFEAIVAPRSSTYKKFGVIQANSIGVIDSSYCGNEDQWMMPVIALKDTTINKGDRVCQFRIQLSQKANIWQKLKWLLSKGIKLVEVDTLDNSSRGGFGTTGVD